MNNWLEIQNLSFGFGSQCILKNISLSLPSNIHVLGVIGPSGVGKTTLLRLIAGFLHPSIGHVAVYNTPVTGPSAQRPMVFQDHNLFPWMNVLDNVSFGLKARGLKKRDRHQAALHLLSEIGLAGDAMRKPSELSGGMQQRVGLARALATEPRCLLLDEPFAALDEKTKTVTQRLYNSTLRERGVHAVHVSHDLLEIAKFSDAVLVLKDPGEARLIAPTVSAESGAEARAEILKAELSGEH